MNEKSFIKTHPIELVKLIIAIIIIIANIYIAYKLLNLGKSIHTPEATTPTINVLEYKNLQKTVSTKQIYSSSSASPNISVPNIF